MTPRDFAYWLQGYFELLDPKGTSAHVLPLAPAQAQCIREHLALVFKHIDPPPAAPTMFGQPIGASGTTVLGRFPGAGGGTNIGSGPMQLDPDGHWVTTAIC